MLSLFNKVVWMTSHQFNECRFCKTTYQTLSSYSIYMKKTHSMCLRTKPMDFTYYLKDVRISIKLRFNVENKNKPVRNDIYLHVDESYSLQSYCPIFL